MRATAQMCARALDFYCRRYVFVCAMLLLLLLRICADHVTSALRSHIAIGVDTYTVDNAHIACAICLLHKRHMRADVYTPNVRRIY